MEEIENIWEILQLEKTEDKNVIRRAYEKRAKEFHPEEAPEEFLRIRRAYEEAIAYAKGAETNQFQADLQSHFKVASSVSQNVALEEVPATEKATVSTQEKTAAPKEFGWNFVQENPFLNREGIHKFRELYTGKRRKDRTAWTDFFLSDAFLEGYREKDFAKLMLEVVQENAEQFPPCKEFLTELYIAYGLHLQVFNTGEDMELRMDENAPFPGMEYIGKIARMGPGIIRFKGNEPAMAAAFRDYRELLLLSPNNVWEDDTLLALGKVINRYMLANISDKPIQNVDYYELSQRHPKSLKLLTHFFSNRGQRLPAKVYRLLWNRLGLESATNGREKLLYGGLREACLSNVPDILGKPKVDFNRLNQEFFYNRGAFCYWNNGETPQKREKLDLFFQRDDVLWALWDEAYVDKQVVRYWITENSGIYLLEKLEEFYTSHKDAPLANHILEKIGQVREGKRIEIALQEDGRFVLDWDNFDLSQRAYLRQYLHTAFHLAHGVQNDVLLAEYLQERMPYPEVWRESLIKLEKKGFFAKHPIEIRFGAVGEDILSIVFHPKYIEYLWNGSPLVPRFSGQELPEVESDRDFWLLVPVAEAPYEAYAQIYDELVNRLSRLPVWEKDIPVIADCIAGAICHFEEDEMPICCLHAQKKDQLFGCDIYENGVLVLYEETIHTRLLLSDNYNAPDLETAVKMGRRLLLELVTDWDVDIRLKQFPKQVLVRNKWGSPNILAGKDVTQEAIERLLQEFFHDKLRRLELDFGGRALVFLKDGEQQQYTCIYFEHQKNRWFCLVGMLEVYEVVDEKDVVYVPFGLGMLPNYLIHHTLGYMKSRLEEIFEQIACKKPNPAPLMWSPHVYFTAEAQRYRLAQRLFGAYPPEQACNRIQERFYIPVVPSYLSYTDLDGNRVQNIDVSKDKVLVQDMLAKYMAEKLGRLVLSWEYLAGVYPGRNDVRERQIVLVQDQGSHQMIYFDDSVEAMKYLVADVEEYMKAEGRKYRKVNFLGRKVPSYLVHTQMRRIRDCLDILIPEIKNPFQVLGQFGEFSYASGEEYERARKEYLL